MKIRITPLEGSSWEVELAAGTTTSFGRSEDCSVTFEERTVSRRHVELYEDETGTLMVRDLGSRYGTRLNGREVKDPSPFYHGDVLDIGGFTVEVPGSTVDARPPGVDAETRRLKKDTRGAHPSVVLPEGGSRSKGNRHILSWLWVVLLIVGLTLLGILLADYLSGGEPVAGDASSRLPASTSPAPPAPSEVASWPSFAHRS